MQDLGFDVLLKGSNMQRLLIGLWTSLRISLIAVVISIFLGLIVGVLMTRKNIILKVFTRVYLEIVRIMPVSYTHLDVYKRQRYAIRSAQGWQART